MKIPTASYSFEQFIETFVSLEFPPYVRPKIACFLTNFMRWEGEPPITLERIFHRHGIRVEPLGDIRRLTAWYFDRDLKERKMATMFAYLNPETKLLLCFTDEKTEAIDQTVGAVAETSTGIYYLFISPKTFEFLKSKILEEHPHSKCYYFTAKHSPQFARRGEVRPEYEKTIIYHGDDALKTLNEVTQYYGVRPRIMRYRIPDLGSVEIKNTGCFALVAAEAPIAGKRFLLELTDIALKDVLVSRRIIETSDFKLIPVRTERKTFEIPKLVPWVITFSQKLEYADSDYLLQSMTNNGYVVFNFAKAKGSLRLNGMVTDENKRNLFTIDVDSERMIIAPRGKVYFDAFLRFFQTLIENFDPGASCAEY